MRPIPRATRQTILILTLIATGIIAPATAAQELGENASPPIDLDLAKDYFAQARLLSDADQGRLWGERLYGPMLLADRSSRFVVANQPDETGYLVQRSGVYVGTLPPDVNIANTAVNWAGTAWTMIMWPLPALQYPRGRLITHELYHRIQDEIGLPAASSENAHLDTAAGRVWLRLEMRALTEALVRDGGPRILAATDALIFRAYRRSLFPDAAPGENALEMNEGLAEYTGFKAGGLPESAIAPRVSVHLERYDQHDNYARAFAYATGPAYGVLLDESGSRWRDRLQPDSDLAEMLREHLQIFTPGVSSIQAMRRAEKYGASTILDQEQSRETVRMARINAYRDRFERQPVLTLPTGSGVSYAFDPNEVETFGDAGTVYRSARVSDEWGVLEVTSGGALMQRDGRVVGRFIVPAPSDVNARPLAGDGWTLTLNDGWRIAANGPDGDLILIRGELADRTSTTDGGGGR